MGEVYVIEDYVVEYVGKDLGQFRGQFFVYCFISSIGQFRLDREDLKEVKPATKLHKILHGVK